ncbi:response regulator [Amylibacter ulvae]|uniref:Response regulator n=1 Tax=Paramylibacter ulvae TaxID=1651968 RepID=A0ABQ3D156_9RHOB|nr:response regulator [Amylibacter ulvae]GHA52428.1 response regulator [Amylibacter ulvae]
MEEFASDDNHLAPRRTAKRPLLGLTILLIEDSRYFADAVRLLAIRSGARLRRADCLESARKHIRIYRPDVVIVDMGLPDGSGVDFITQIVAIGQGAPKVIAMSGADYLRGDALASGAAQFIEKPFFDLAGFQQSVLSVLDASEKSADFVPRVAGDAVEPDEDAYEEDLRDIAKMMDAAIIRADHEVLQYTAQFLQSVARVAHDQEMMECATRFAARLAGDDWKSNLRDLQCLVRGRLTQASV